LSIIRLAARLPHRRRPVSSTLGRGMQLERHRHASATRQEGRMRRASIPLHSIECEKLRQTAAETRNMGLVSSEVRAMLGNEFSKGASRRRAAPGSRLGQFSRRYVCRSNIPHGTKTRKQCKAAALPQASALSSQLRLRYKQHMSAPSRKPLPNLSLNRSANGVPPGPRGSCGSSSASRPRRHTAVAQLALR
jgi:hypothetical protein